MRIKTPALWLTSVLKLASHAAMGVAMGLVFTLVLSIADPAGMITLIRHSATPGLTWTMFVGTVVLTFAIGATLTGFVFIMTEEAEADGPAYLTWSCPHFVAGIHVFKAVQHQKAWMAGTSPANTML